MYDIDLWKKRKKKLKLTLDDIAQTTGIGISTIKDIFRGATYAPRIDTVQAIEAALGITHKDDNALSPAERRLLDSFNALNAPMQEYVLDMVEKLVASQK